MRLHRIYTEQQLNSDLEIELEGAPARHLLQVLRLKQEQPLILFNGDGHDYSGLIIQTSRRSARIRITDQSDPEPAPRLAIHLAIGISKGERMDFALQKSVELGVTEVTPLLTERSVVRLPAERQQKRLEHWRGIILSACEQSGRRRIPQCNPVQTLPQWLASRHHSSGILLDHRAQMGLQQLPPPHQQISLLVGPEGGLSSIERQQAVASSLTAVRLGPRVLRTETAPLAAIAAIQLLWGDLN